MDRLLLEKRPWLKNYDWKTPWEINYPDMAAHHILRNTAVLHPDKTATWFYGTEISYRELYRQVLWMTNSLIQQGLKKGDRVGIMLPNCPQFVISFWSILMAGGIIVNINPLYTTNELNSIIESTELTGLITFDAMIPLVQPLSKNIHIPLIAVTRLSDFMGTGASEALTLEEGWHHFIELVEGEKNECPPHLDIQPDDPAVIQFTGGTTGLPKGATLTHANMVAAAHNVVLWTVEFVDAISIPERIVMSVLPYSHVYGEVCCLMYSTYSASTQVILPRFELEEVMDTLDLFDKFTYFPCVPTMMAAVINHPRAEEIDFVRKISYFGSGAAPCPMDLINKAKKMDVCYNEGWGMSETASLGISNPLVKVKPMSIGVPYIGVDVRIVNPDTMEDVPQGEPGEILIKSPTLMKGYWNNPEENDKAFTKDGWFHTGDMAYFDEEYYVFIVDRTKDMIIAGGYNIYPREVDEVLFKHPKVKDAITVGIPHKYRGETVKAFVQLVAGAQVTEEELIAYCRENMAAFKIPRSIEFREELPRTSVGKALRRLLRDEEINRNQD